MYAVNNVPGEIERRRRLSAFKNNLTALVSLVLLGFPVTPATIRTIVAGWAILAVASLQSVLRRIGPQVRLAPIRTTRERVSGPNRKA